MASEKAQCRIRVKVPRSMIRESEDHTDQLLESMQTLITISSFDDWDSVPQETLLQWTRLISDMFFKRQDMTDHSCVRDWDLVLDLDGSVENIASDQVASSSVEKFYPIRYRLPSVIWKKLSTNAERVQRAELFALGSILYELIAGHQLFEDIGQDEKDEEEIHSLITKGEFPEELWTLKMAVRILACWCPAFAKEMLAAHGKDSLPKVATGYIKKHPILFGLQVLGGTFTIASVFALPVLGAIGFSAAGPLAGSAAAAWQASMGVVQGGSIFAWCQSAAMGGAAVGGILVTGLSGGGIAVGATVAGALSNENADEIPDLRERFLSAWKKEML